MHNSLRDFLDPSGLALAFKDRRSAASMLSSVLCSSVKGKKNRRRMLVLGIPRGGVVIADMVARRLGADFDVIVPRKLRAPDNNENSFGAIMPDGSVYLDDFRIKWLKVSKNYVEKEKQDQLLEIERKVALYRPNNRGYAIEQNTIIVIDDGIATGATLIAAARWIRKQKPERLIIAAPVAQKEALDLLRKEADEVKTILTPSNFLTVNQFYRNFDPINDEEVIEIIKSRSMASISH